MKYDPKISVIIPAFNAELNINKTINSLKNQTYTNFEVIIIDDGSTDNTSLIIKQLTSDDTRFKYIYKSNGGVSSARNRGIKESLGKYVSFLDSDDFYDKTFIEEMYKKIEKTQSDICFCGYNIVNNNVIKEKKTGFTSNNYLLDYLLGNLRLHTTSWMINREFLIRSNILFNEDMAWGEDTLFFSEILSNSNDITSVNKYLTNYVEDHDGTQLSDFNINMIDKDAILIQKLRNSKNINVTLEVDRAITFREQYLLMNKLNQSLKLYPRKDVMDKYKSYLRYPIKKSCFNGLRSIKLLLLKFKFKILFQIWYDKKINV